MEYISLQERQPSMLPVKSRECWFCPVVTDLDLAFAFSWPSTEDPELSLPTIVWTGRTLMLFWASNVVLPSFHLPFPKSAVVEAGCCS